MESSNPSLESVSKETWLDGKMIDFNVESRSEVE